MELSIVPKLVVVGDQTLALDKLESITRIEPHWNEDLGLNIVSSEISLMEENRVLALCEQYRGSLIKCYAKTPLILLLPTHLPPSQLKSLVSFFVDSFGLLKDVPFKLFPYGSASFHVAKEAISKCIDKESECLVIAVSAASRGIDEHQDTITTDSIVVMQAKASKQDCVVGSVFIDQIKSVHTGRLESFLKNVSQQIDSPISNFLLPLTKVGDKPYWIPHIDHFSGSIDKYTVYENLHPNIDSLGAGAPLIRKSLWLEATTNNAQSTDFTRQSRVCVHLERDESDYTAAAIYRLQ